MSFNWFMDHIMPIFLWILFLISIILISFAIRNRIHNGPCVGRELSRTYEPKQFIWNGETWVTIPEYWDLTIRRTNGTICYTNVDIN